MLRKSRLILVTALVCIALPTIASAHQPRLVESRNTVVSDPEVSKAYYGQLTGVPDTYSITTTRSFNLYVNILVPDIDGQKKDVVAVIRKDGLVLAELGGVNDTWKPMFEPFGYDKYFQGSEYKNTAGAGTYEITVSSAANDSKYSLAVGEIEKFDFKETMNALKLVPQLKRTFFNESPISFIFSPFGWGLILILYVLAGAAGLLYRFVLRKVARSSNRGSSKNIGVSDRLIRFAIGIALLLWAITTSWSIVLIFFSGFAIFEGLFSWCGFYAAIGKNTCTIE